MIQKLKIITCVSQTSKQKYVFLKINYPKLKHVINEIINCYIYGKQISIIKECI